MFDLTNAFRKHELPLQLLDLHSNNITTEGLYRLLMCLKADNQVKTLNVSRNAISSDLKMFKTLTKFLSCNKILEDLNMSFCGLKPKAAELLGKGIRGNTTLQVLNLKGNEIKKSIADIAKPFIEFKKPLCIRDLDLSKCHIESEHITLEVLTMISNKDCTLKVLSLRDNFIKQQAGEQISEAMKHNRSIVKLAIDYNPIKQNLCK